MTEYNGGDLLVRLMRDQGVDTAFGVVSIHNLPLVGAVARELRFVPVRHEAAAVNAADGYARVSGGLGVAITSTGTGAGNAAGSLVEAQAAGSRVLHVTGQIDSAYLGAGRGVIHEARDQLGMLASICKHAATVPSAADAAGVLRAAVARARSLPYGPASVEWPIDLQYAAQPPASVSSAPDADPPSAATADPALVAEAAGLIATARRPLIWAGGGAVAAGEWVRRLAEWAGAGVLTSNSGRGTVPEDHPLLIGNFASNPAAADLLDAADLLVAVGTHFRSNETRHYGLRLPERQVQIDIDPAALGRVYPATVGVVGEASEVLRAVLGAIPEQAATEPSWPERVAATRAGVRARVGADIGPYLPICRAIRDRLPSESPIVRDVTIPSSMWGNRLLEIYRPETNVFAVAGGIGQSLGMGIGAASARPEVPTLVLAGDGGLAVHLGELATLAQERPWLTVLVCNDGGYGVLRNMQDAHVGRRAGVDLHTPDFGGLATALGLPHQLVRAPERFAEALDKALAERGPSILELDVTALGPLPAPFVPPVHVPK